jgi:hypothetical protein
MGDGYRICMSNPTLDHFNCRFLVFRDESNMLRRDLIGCIQNQIITISIWKVSFVSEVFLSSDELIRRVIDWFTWKEQQNRKMNTNTVITVMSSQPLIQRSWNVKLISFCERPRSVRIRWWEILVQLFVLWYNTGVNFCAIYGVSFAMKSHTHWTHCTALNADRIVIWIRFDEEKINQESGKSGSVEVQILMMCE